MKSKTKRLFTNSTRAITSSKPCCSFGKVIAFADNIGYPMKKPMVKVMIEGKLKDFADN